MTQKQYVTIRNPKMYLHTKFLIPVGNEIQIYSGLDLSRTEAGGQCHSDLETVVDASRPKDISTYCTKIGSYMSYNMGDMLCTRFNRTDIKVKVTVTKNNTL